MQRKSNCTCKVCKQPIYRRPSQITGGNVFCSQKCCGESQQSKHSCPICQKVYVGKKKNCSRGCANKARVGITYTKENKFNKAYKGKALKEKLAYIRGGACEKCTMNNYAILQVHYKVERHKGGHEKLHNLELLCPNCHATYHFGRGLFTAEKML